MQTATYVFEDTQVKFVFTDVGDVYYLTCIHTDRCFLERLNTNMHKMEGWDLDVLTEFTTPGTWILSLYQPATSLIL